MDKARIHEGIRRMRFARLLEQQSSGEITQAEMASALGVTVRTVQRWTDRFEEQGADGLADGRLHRPSPRRAPREELERMLGLYRERYSDFTVKHFHEHLQKRHDYVLGYTVTRLALQSAGLVMKAAKRSAHRKKRPRRSVRGMMLHQDGSRHAWLEGQAPLDLIVTMDDATSENLSMFLVEEEGTASTFRGLREVVEEHGLFCELYSDRGSHYAHTPKAGGPATSEATQVGRALKQLGITAILARSPEARGRSERMFRTLQGRIPKELRLEGIRDIEAANVWLKAYRGEADRLFAVEPEHSGSAFVTDRDGAWREILCEQEERVVGKDNTVAWNGLSLQLPESPLRPHFVRARVRVHTYPDGALAVFLGPHCLARYTSAIAAPSPSSLAAGSVPSRRGLAASERAAAAACRPSLTAPATAADRKLRAGTEKRTSSRTKKPGRRRADEAHLAMP